MGSVEYTFEGFTTEEGRLLDITVRYAPGRWLTHDDPPDPADIEILRVVDADDGEVLAEDDGAALDYLSDGDLDDLGEQAARRYSDDEAASYAEETTP